MDQKIIEVDPDYTAFLKVLQTVQWLFNLAILCLINLESFSCLPLSLKTK